MSPMEPLTARVSQVTPESPGVSTFTVELPGPELIDTFRPGQFSMIGLPAFGEVPIAFSSVRSRTVGCYTVRTAGRVTQAISRLEVGDGLQVRGPFGTGWPFEELKGHDLILLIGGMGIIPLRTFMHQLLKTRHQFGKVLVLYGAKEPVQMLFLDDVNQWGHQPGIETRFTVDEVPAGVAWNHEVGVVTELLDHPSRGTPADVALICGPELMMRFAVRQLLVRGMRPYQLFVSMERHMKCGIGHCGHCQLGPNYVCKDGPVLPYSRVRPYPDNLL